MKRAASVASWLSATNPSVYVVINDNNCQETVLVHCMGYFARGRKAEFSPLQRSETLPLSQDGLCRGDRINSKREPIDLPHHDLFSGGNGDCGDGVP